MMNSTQKLYNKLSIIIFSTLGSTFFGALLYSQNLRDTGNGKQIAPTMIFAIVYSIAGAILPSQLGIESYYTFIPIHLIGGLLLAGPFWNHHIKLDEAFKARNVLGPALVLATPIAFLTFMHMYNSDQKLSVGEFEQEAQTAALEAMENEIYVSQDSSLRFFDISLPLSESSYYFRTDIENVSTVYNDIIWEDGFFRTLCIRVPLKEKEEFGKDIITEKLDSVSFKDCINEQFNTIICAEYENSYGDTLMVYGEVALLKVDRVVYYFTTQHYDLDKSYADDLSVKMIERIRPLNPTEVKKD